MGKQNETKRIYMVCDGVGMYFTSEYSAEQILDYLERGKGLASSPFIEIDKGFYVDANKISLIREVTTDMKDTIIPINI